MASTEYKLAFVISFIGIMLVGTTVGIWYVVDSQRIRVGYVKNDFNDFSFLYAKDNGLFQDAKIDFKYLEFTSDRSLVDALLQDKIDVAIVSFASLLLNGAHPEDDIKIISLASVNGSGIIVRNDSGIHDANTMLNHSISVPEYSTFEMVLLEYYMNSTLNISAGSNVNISDYLNLTVKSGDSLPSLMNASVIDGYVSRELVASKGISNGYIGEYLVKSGDLLPNHPNNVIVARDSMMKNLVNKDLLKSFLKILYDTTSLFNNASEHDDIIDSAQLIFSSNEDTCEMAFNNTGFLMDPNLTSVQNFIDVMVDLDMLTIPVNSSELVSQYFDLSILNEVLP
ncbi:MAG: ABC transporter substrate-binding protein [Promethearchaeota archaeon]